jgi:hypothetical protein
MLKRSYAVLSKHFYLLAPQALLLECVLYIGGDQIWSFGVELFGRTLEFGIITSPRILTNLSPD